MHTSFHLSCKYIECKATHIKNTTQESKSLYFCFRLFLSLVQSFFLSFFKFLFCQNSWSSMIFTSASQRSISLIALYSLNRAMIFILSPVSEPGEASAIIYTEMGNSERVFLASDSDGLLNENCFLSIKIFTAMEYIIPKNEYM